MLSLQNFETQIDPTILQRGKQYYSQKAIALLEETEDNVWQAEVEGSETYQVELSLADKNEISSYACDCPYDGDICKHVVAVLFAVRTEVKKPEGKQRKQKRSAERNVFENLLQTISTKEYQDFIRQYASKHKDFKTEFELFFAEKDERIDVGKKYEKLIQALIRKYSDRGFVDYRATFGLSKEIDKVLDSGHNFIAKRNFSDAFILAKVVLKAMMEVVSQCDDSAGNIGSTLDDTIQLIEDITIAEQAAPDLKEQIFTFLKGELSGKEYFDYGDMGYELFGVFQNLAIQLHKSDEFIGFIDARLPQLSGRYNDYRKEYFQKQKIEFLAATGKTGEAEALVQQSLDIVEVRQGEVEKAIAKKDYTSAKKLIADGIKIAEGKDHPGTVSAWQKELLRLAVLENDTAAIRRLSRHFAFHQWFSEEYYKQWKATFNKAEWKEVIENFIAITIKEVTKAWESQKSSYWRPAHPPLLQKLAPVYIQEHYWHRLLALVQKENNLDITLSYHTYLAPHYPAELLEIYLPAFAAQGQQANGRGEYANLVRKMQKVMQDIPKGKEKIKAIARSLKEQFPRRPAMVEELNKVLK